MVHVILLHSGAAAKTVILEVTAVNERVRKGWHGLIIQVLMMLLMILRWNAATWEYVREQSGSVNVTKASLVLHVSLWGV